MNKYFFPILFLFCGITVSAQKDSTIVPGLKPLTDVTSAPSKIAEFPGGHQAFVRKILDNFHTPPLVKADIVKAKAVATFIVDTEGNMTDIKIESYQHQMVRDEFLKALKMIKTKWIPAEQNGQKVKSLMRQPLIFNLQ
ncbi:Gram-negative bacterial tonB protein [Chryseobacterium populi]|uniref:Gram-negative bacterial tonB protein n=1 Tax=Chryseobacterium populi TaxID=1144316 RepID=J2KCG0_9FLAO|nr:Gram-negative bacterial tonB protein [Chryseobacterium populi]EJL70853.1 Gram-negative bacterial tonB protein [Chryseobacterium populi]